MASSVEYNTMFSQSWQNVKDLINNNSNVADPTTTSAEYRKWVYSREPDVKATNFAGYPFIVVNATMIRQSDTQTVDGKKRMVMWDCEVEVVTSDRGANDDEGNGLSHIDAISDDLMEVFNSVTHRNTLKGNGMFFSNPEATSVSTEALHNELVYRRSFLLSFKAFKQVVA